MVYGDAGKFGIVSNVESATCRAGGAVEGSNPTLTARYQKHSRWPLTARCLCELRGSKGVIAKTEIGRTSATPRPSSSRFRGPGGAVCAAPRLVVPGRGQLPCS